jgi:hypothetical protein
LLIFTLKIAGQAINRWADFCEERLKNHPKTCSAAIFSPPVIAAGLIAYGITAQAHYHIAGYPLATFLIWFLPISVGVLFWYGIAASIAE